MSDPQLQNQLAALIVQATDDAVIGKSLDGTIASWNPGATRLLGYEAAEAVGRPFVELVPESRRGEVEALLLKARRGERARGETTLLRKDGSTVDVSLSMAPVAPGGKPTGIATIARDMTEMRGLEKQLHEAQLYESLGILAGGIAHDFNNLLTVVMGNASVVKAMIGTESKLWEFLDDIETAAQRAADLAGQMLSFSGKGVFLLQRLDVNSLSKEIADLLQVGMPKDVELRYDLAPVLPKVEADATQLRQVIMNLVINAAQALGEKRGSVTVSTRLGVVDREFLAGVKNAPELTPGEYVMLRVTDTGHGMDTATIRKIFDPFFTTKKTGRGLGLSAVLGIMRGHKGGVRVDSRPGQGSTFTLLFPSGGSLAPKTKTQVHRESDTWRGQGTVLVVDDEEKLRDMARGALEFLGFRVLLAADGVEGVEMMKKHRDEIVAVLLDLTMPRLSGDRALPELRKINPAVKVVLISGYNEQQAVRQFEGGGVEAFVKKPFGVEVLRVVLRKVLQPV